MKEEAVESRAKHTRGPWEVRSDGEMGLPFVVGPVKKNGKRDRIALFPLSVPLAQAKARARLIALAPEMADALREIRKELEDGATEVGIAIALGTIDGLLARLEARP